ncbi:MAG: hypothetical protein H0T56_14785, partial [Pseudaminobacter sp.]|nr:hypothetical protein [Pseudaminobacter sp.]
MPVTAEYVLINGENFQANGYTDFDQSAAEVIGLSNGGFAVVYRTGLFQPHVTFYGPNRQAVEPVSTPYGDGNLDMIGDPEIIELSNGNVAVIWDDGSAGANQVLGTIMNPATGDIVSGPFQVSLFAG